jgi:hypothetical protein
MYRGGEFLYKVKSYKKYVNLIKHKFTFKTYGKGERDTKPNTVYTLPWLDKDVYTK